jgi:transposase-like protein
VLTEGSGQVAIEVPRDRDGTFEPQIVRKRQRRLNGVDEIVLSLYAKGPTTGEISAHFAEIYGASVSRETVSRITGRVTDEMQAWQARPLDEVYAAVFTDATVKARGHFPTEQAAIKCLCLVNRSLDPTGTGRTRWTTRWKPALNAFAITFAAGNTVGEIVPINAV